MTLVSILDSLRENLNLRNELREKLEKLYPGMFNLNENYYIKVENWNTRYTQIIKIFCCLLDTNCNSRYIIKNNISLGLLIGEDILYKISEKENSIYQLGEKQINSINNAKIIEIEDIISEIILLTENFYYYNKNIIISGTSFIDSIDLVENDIIFRMFLRKKLEKIYPGIMNSDTKNIYYIPQNKENEFIIYRLHDLLRILYRDNKGIGSTNKGIMLSGLFCHINVWKSESEQTKREKEINEIINSGKCNTIKLEEIISTIELITKEYTIWKN